jgi:hypothetical protein
MIGKRLTNQTHAVIQDTSKVLPRLESSQVKSALGAEQSGLVLRALGSPLALTLVRQELLERLRSTGGRPSLANTSRRVKIPLGEHQWEELEEIASAVATPEFSPSAGQIASVLITLSLRSLREDCSPRKQLAQ